MLPPARGRGRPRAADPEDISRAALALIAQRGYGATTMADIADTVGVSEPTLFRYFPTKAAILWHGMEDSSRLFRAAFAGQAKSMPLVEAVFNAYLEMLHRSPVGLMVIKRRIAVASESDGAAEAAWLRFEEWHALVASFVAERRSLAPDSLEAIVVGGMIWAALWSGVTAWARSDDEDPSVYVERARTFVTITD